jgi:KDO2-lipid IV(A) lauroyltransferase
VHIYRDDSGIQVIESEPPLEVDYAREARETEIPRITQEVTSILERWIREHPEQYFWLHRRWKSTPDGQWLYRKRA